MLGATYMLLFLMSKGVPMENLTQLDIEAKIEMASLANNINPKRMLDLAKCESNLNPKAYNKDDPHGGAHGLFQWLQPTWEDWEKKYGKKMDIYDYNDQIKLTAYALGAGKWKMWSCNRKIPNSSLTYK
jgi:hypothetical protein